MLVTGRFEDARRVFMHYRNYCREGLIPNFIPDLGGQPIAYNSVDATLWYVNAVWQYLKYTGDFEFVHDQLWQTLEAIVENLVKGTMFDIRVDSNGLLSHGGQLTWMDAAVDGQAVTPRAGKAVEVQVLWFNALKIMELLANRFGEKDEAAKYSAMADMAKKSFAKQFWNEERDCLFDVVDVNGSDVSLRPNQIIAVALDFTMFDNERCERVVDIVKSELLTECGLRTLARSDPRYTGVYSGDRASRDRAYHNGTVWPWLLGPFTSAYLKAKGSTDCTREFAFNNFLLPLFTEHLAKSGANALAEIFDGDPPHMPRGCIAQAWSVAELLRTYAEDIMHVRPKYEKQILESSR
jgi:predicted glycogen debranching enzyme